MRRTLLLVPRATASGAYIAFEYDVGPGPSFLAIGVADERFGRFEGPSSAILLAGGT
jgi:hypothetical protein